MREIDKPNGMDFFIIEFVAVKNQHFQRAKTYLHKIVFPFNFAYTCAVLVHLLCVETGQDTTISVHIQIHLHALYGLIPVSINFLSIFLGFKHCYLFFLL
jgi:hypothetical protein